MADHFFISDTHFGHAATFDKFLTNSLPMRPFSSVEEMNETIVQRWNDTVRPSDKVYHLGDVAMRRDAIAIVGRLNGHKRLIPGNHDIFNTKYYLPYFEDIYGMRVFDDMVLTHAPLHPESVKKRWWANVHGHVHNNVPMLHFGAKYLNVSVEATNYRPLAYEEIRQRMAAQKAYHEMFIADPMAAMDQFEFHGSNGQLLWVTEK